MPARHPGDEEEHDHHELEKGHAAVVNDVQFVQAQPEHLAVQGVTDVARHDSAQSRMRQTAFYIGQPCQEDRIVLVVTVSLEYEFVPVADAQAVFQQVV